MTMTEDLIHDKGYLHDMYSPIVSQLNPVLQLAPLLIYPHDFKDVEVSWISDIIHQDSEERLTMSDVQCCSLQDHSTLAGLAIVASTTSINVAPRQR